MQDEVVFSDTYENPKKVVTGCFAGVLLNFQHRLDNILSGSLEKKLGDLCLQMGNHRN